jgi:hypothetical protein
LRGSLWPAPKDRCGACGGPIQGAVVYLNAGSIADVAKSKIVGQEIFWNCGIHVKDGRSYDLEILRADRQDQFDLSFCSIKCLREFFTAIVDRIEAESRP